MKPTKANVAAVMDVLDGADPEITLEGMARAVLEAAWVEYEKRAKFVVVGQRYEFDGRPLRDGDGAAVKFALPPAATKGDATSKAHSLANGDGFRAWVLPIMGDTPAAVKKSLAPKAEVVEDDRAGRGLRIGYGEFVRRANQWCRHIDFQGDDVVECRRLSGHGGEHGLWSKEVGYEVLDYRQYVEVVESERGR